MIDSQDGIILSYEYLKRERPNSLKMTNLELVYISI